MTAAVPLGLHRPGHEPLPRRLRPVRSEPPLDRIGTTPDGALVLPLPTRRRPAPAPPTRLEAGTDESHAAVDGDRALAELFGARPTVRSALPDPRNRAAAAVRILLEVLCGDRPARQVASWVSPALLERLELRGPDRIRREPRRSQLRSLRVSEPAPCVVEASAVVSALFAAGGGIVERFRAVALRLEGIEGRWVVTALTVG